MSRGKKTADSIDELINEKMRVLEDFYVVNNENYNDIRYELKDAIKSSPKSDPAFVLDRVARNLIMASF